jgi:hypothetical protein
MRTLLIRGDAEPPRELREIVRAGSTEMDEVTRADALAAENADRVVIWNGRHVEVENRRLRWPEDEDELRLYFQSAG